MIPFYPHREIGIYFNLSNLKTLGLLVDSTIPFMRKERLRLVVFFVRMWRLKGF